MMRTNQFPLVDGGPPRLAESAGLGRRYYYWCGASGRRYLFTQVAAEALPDFRDALVVLARRSEGGAMTGEAAVPVGAEDGPERVALAARLAVDPGLLAFVHLLAPTERARRAAVDDLIGVSTRLAA